MWNNAARHAHLPSRFKDVNLWLDSTDVPNTYKKVCDPESDDWSGKLGHPARRFMVLQDAKGRVLKVWGGYSMIHISWI